jgi:hypothetical protein
VCRNFGMTCVFFIEGLSTAPQRIDAELALECSLHGNGTMRDNRKSMEEGMYLYGR